MGAGGFSAKRLTRLRGLLDGYVDSGLVPGMVAVLARHGHVHVEAIGRLAFEGAGAATPMGTDTICRVASVSKPIVAACAMTLVEDCTLRLDDPVDEFLPELAGMRVLADPAGPLTETVAARRPVTLRDLLTFTLGTGMVLDDSPIAAALDTVGEPPLDEWVRRLGALPLVHQPGERWMYETAADATGALIQRATGKTFGEVLRERIFEPLAMTDTDFSVPAGKLDRFATAYPQGDSRTVLDAPDGLWSRPPEFEGGGGGLVSTADDLLAFGSALLAGTSPILSRASVALMTTNQLSAQQRAVSGFYPGYFDHIGWGFGFLVRTGRTHLGPSVGAYGSPGMYGTAWFNDPAEDLTTVFMLQRAHLGDQQLPMWNDIWTTVYQAIDD